MKIPFLISFHSLFLSHSVSYSVPSINFISPRQQSIQTESYRCVNHFALIGREWISFYIFLSPSLYYFSYIWNIGKPTLETSWTGLLLLRIKENLLPSMCGLRNRFSILVLSRSGLLVSFCECWLHCYVKGSTKCYVMFKKNTREGSNLIFCVKNSKMFIQFYKI